MTAILKHQIFSASSVSLLLQCQITVAAHDDDDGGGSGLVVVLTIVLLSDGLQQAICRTFTDREQRNGGRSFCFRLQQLQVTLCSNSKQPEAADATTVDSHLLPRKAGNRRTFYLFLTDKPSWRHNIV